MAKVNAPKNKKGATALGVLGTAAVDLIRGAPQPPLHTFINMIRASRAQHDAKRALATKVSRPKPLPRVKVIGPEEPIPTQSKKETVIKPAMQRGMNAAASRRNPITSELRFDMPTTTSFHYGEPAKAPVARKPETTFTPSFVPPVSTKHPAYEDAVAALKTLAMKDVDARRAVDRVESSVPHTSPVNELVRLALKNLKN